MKTVYVVPLDSNEPYHLVCSRETIEFIAEVMHGEHARTGDVGAHDIDSFITDYLVRADQLQERVEARNTST